MTHEVRTSPRLYIFAGLPGTGKTTLATGLARRLKAAYLRIDTIEQALRDLCSMEVYGEGYEMAYRVAADNLRVGVSVVADSCNPIEVTRKAWERMAAGVGAHFINIEVICSDKGEHRHRVDTRSSTITGLELPTWSEVTNREYDEWSDDRIVIDTAGRSASACIEELLPAVLHMTRQGAP